MIENFPLLFILSKIEELIQCIPLKANSLKSLFDSAILVSPEFLFIQPFKTISELKKSFREEFLSETAKVANGRSVSWNFTNS